MSIQAAALWAEPSKLSGLLRRISTGLVAVDEDMVAGVVVGNPGCKNGLGGRGGEAGGSLPISKFCSML